MTNAKEIDWDGSYAAGHDYRPVTAREVDLYVLNLPRECPMTHLDIGCGTGQLTRETFHRGFTVTGIDPSHTAIAIAQSRSVRPVTYHAVELAQFRGLQAHASIGLITCRLVYAFVPDRPAFLQSVASLLHPQGCFYVLTPDPAVTPAHKQHIAVDLAQAAQELDQYFSVSQTSYEALRLFACRHRKP